MNKPGALIVERSRAIECLGVTYAHSGHWSTPVRELLGRHSLAKDPISHDTFFQRDDIAQSHLRAVARADARRKLENLQALQSGGLRQQKLWLARNWDWLRTRQVGMLSTQAIFDRSVQDATLVLEQGPTIRIERLPEQIRLPQVLTLGTDVWILDTRGFPRSAPIITRSQVSETLVRASPEHTAFDFIVQYRLSDAPGLYGFDTADAEETKLSQPPGAPSAYLTEEAARIAMSKFAAKVQTVLAIAGSRIRHPLAGQDTQYLEDHTNPTRPDAIDVVYEFEILPEIAEPPQIALLPPPEPAMVRNEALTEADGEQPLLPPIASSAQVAKPNRLKQLFMAVFASREAPPDGGAHLLEHATDLQRFLASGVRLIRPSSVTSQNSLAGKVLKTEHLTRL